MTTTTAADAVRAHDALMRALVPVTTDRVSSIVTPVTAGVVDSSPSRHCQRCCDAACRTFPPAPRPDGRRVSTRMQASSCSCRRPRESLYKRRVGHEPRGSSACAFACAPERRGGRVASGRGGARVLSASPSRGGAAPGPPATRAANAARRVLRRLQPACAGRTSGTCSSAARGRTSPRRSARTTRARPAAGPAEGVCRRRRREVGGPATRRRPRRPRAPPREAARRARGLSAPRAHPRRVRARPSRPRPWWRRADAGAAARLPRPRRARHCWQARGHPSTPAERARPPRRGRRLPALLAAPSLQAACAAAAPAQPVRPRRGWGCARRAAASRRRRARLG